MANKTGTANKGVYKMNLAKITESFARHAGISSSFVTCYDTSGRAKIGKDSLLLYAGQNFPSRDGNFLIPGQYAYYGSPRPFYGGFLMKADQHGNILWAKYYDSLNAGPNHWLNYYQVLELRDGSILLGGSGSEPISQNNEFIVTKTDASGNVIWTKDMYSRLWTAGSGSADYFYLHQWQQDITTEDIFMCGPSWAKGILIMRMNSITGNMLWSNAYMLNSNGYVNDRIAGIVVRGNEVVALGTYANYNSHIMIYRLNRDNGDTISTKMLQLNETPYYKYAFISPGPVQVLTNGDIAFGGWQGGYWEYLYNGVNPLYQAGITILDQNFDFKKGVSFTNRIEGNGYNTEVTIHPDGSGVFTMLEVLSGYTGREVIAQFKDTSIIKQRNRYFTNEGYPSESFYHQLSNGAELSIRLVGDSIHNSGDLVFSKLSLSDTASACMGYDDNITTTSPFTYQYQGYAYADSIKRNIFLERRPRQVVAAPFIMDNPLPVCVQTSFCDSLSLLGGTDTVCTNAPVLIKVRKNKECGSMVQFDLDGPFAPHVIRLNDSTYQATFRFAWEGYLKAHINGCTDLEDSIFFKVYANPDPLNLGPDLLICPENEVQATAQPGYVSYLWQDGSSLPYFIIQSAGTYHVTVTDGCGNIFSDTIQVSPQPAFPLYIGADRTICSGDRITLNASTGFTTYEWQPNYNISSTSGGAVQVYPSVDTIYTVKAEMLPGCFSFDTVKIKVNTAPAIELGNNKELCQGETAVLDAGNGFSDYSWSSGSSAQAITVSTSGTFNVTALTTDGCRSTDTVTVTIHSNPVVNLGPDGHICFGDARLLNAGANMSAYLWNNNSTFPVLSVSEVGSYWVNVVDGNGCRGTDTVTILAVLSPPEKFFAFTDTLICSYGSINIQPVAAYQHYLWNNNFNGRLLTITRPGIYWLEVTDQFGCKGRDSISVIEKQCLAGLFVPSAFTPNNDQKNDYLKANLFGNIQQFEFNVFNRYGQPVFSTKDPSKGWDGTLKGVNQSAGNFVWICRYRINNEPERIEKGSSLLIR